METILIEDTSTMTIKGAKKMCSSTPNQAVVETVANSVVVTGSNLEIKKLDLEGGEVSLSGKIANVKFSALGAGKTPLIKRIFK